MKKVVISVLLCALSHAYVQSMHYEWYPQVEICSTGNLTANAKKYCLLKGAWVTSSAQRTINPIQSEECESLYREKCVIIPPQLWLKKDGWELRLDQPHRSDYFWYGDTDFFRQGAFFDGINTQQIGLVARTVDGLSEHPKHKVYILDCEQGNLERPEKNELQGLINQDDTGQLVSLVLHRHENRYVRSIQHAYNQKPYHCIRIDDISKPEGKNFYVNEPVALSKVDFVLKKALHLYDRNYFGLTTNGKILSFRLKDNNQLEYMSFEMRPSGICFVDVAADYATVLPGCLPKVGLLDADGGVYITDLNVEGAPTLWYTGFVSNAQQVDSFLYDKGQCAVMYKNAYGDYDAFCVWQDKSADAIAEKNTKQ